MSARDFDNWKRSTTGDLNDIVDDIQKTARAMPRSNKKSQKQSDILENVARLIDTASCLLSDSNK